MRTGGLRKKINCRVAFPSRKCKFKSFPMHFPFICCAVLQKQSSTGQKIQKSFLLNCKYNLNSPKSTFPHLEASSPASYKSRRQFSFRLSSLQCHPGLVFFFFFFLQYWHANHAVLTSFLFSQFFWNILFSTVNSFGGVPHRGSTVYSVNCVSARSPHPALPSRDCLLD